MHNYILKIIYTHLHIYIHVCKTWYYSELGVILVACMLAWCARHFGVVNMSYFISIPGPESQTCMPAAAAATLMRPVVVLLGFVICCCIVCEKISDSVTETDLIIGCFMDSFVASQCF